MRVIWGRAVSQDGISAAGTAVAADAPPASDKDTPAIPNTGTDFVRRFRFEACFACDIVESSHTFEEIVRRMERSVALFVRFARHDAKPLVPYLNTSHRKPVYFQHAAGTRRVVSTTVCGSPSWRESLCTVRPSRRSNNSGISNEHNLDLEFNSLDAQREACEAYEEPGTRGLALGPWPL